MPRNETILNVFLASPGDVSEEREALESIVHELNKSWSRTLGVRFELVRWETDVYPGFGDDPQDVINHQIDSEYDVFIGIFWGRIGTKTPRSDSGSLEEFELAYKRLGKANPSLDIMIYFKDAPIPPSRLDPKQLERLQFFKSSLGSLGGLYWDFEDISDFESTLRTHLSAVAQKWSKKDKVDAAEKVEPNIEEAIEEKDSSDDYGFLDYLEKYNSLNNEMCLSLGHITNATIKVSEAFEARTKAIDEITSGGETYEISDAKKIIKLASEDMDRYSKLIDSQIPVFASSKDGALDALSKALMVYRDFNVDSSDLESLNKNINGMREAAIGSKVGLKKFRESVSALPRITNQSNRAKKGVLKSLDKMLSEISSTIQVTQNIVDSITEIREDSKN
ncbi:hypothetical protein RSO41_06555 [Halomonas sp. I1]|uniref:hypothetical protein n=1 Tax=Halomonas sp. I1 TaxID=393536 RepID=UPI0028DE0F79|nr:hypothetical protein [Halomonas sp. I1]MDT8894313.1 hypothetical protein [Halomonas sp. I1]